MDTAIIEASQGPQPGNTEARGRPKTSFTADVLKLVSGTTFAQVLTILAAPIIARLYAPEAYGLLALFTSVTGILGVIACMRYELAIMLPEKDDGAANLLGVCLGFSLLIALFTVPIIWLAKGPFLQWVHAPGLAPYLWLVPVLVFVHGVFLALNYWNSRTRHFGRLSIARVLSSLTTTSTKLGAGFTGYATSAAMIGATVGGQVVALAVLGGQIWRDDGQLFLKTIGWRDMVLQAKQHRKFPLFDIWSALLNTISVQLPALLLSTFFSPMIVGFYALGHGILAIPMSLIGGAVGQVFYQRASEAKIEGRLSAVVERTLHHLVLLSAFPFLLLAIIGPDIFKVVFGEQWAQAGVFTQILAPWLFFVFLGSPISTLYPVLGLQEAGLIFNIVLVASRAGSLVIGGLRGDILLALVLFSASGTVMWAGFCVYLASKSSLSLPRLAKAMVARMVTALVFLLPIALVKWVLVWNAHAILFTSIVATLLYYSYAIGRDEGIRSHLVTRLYQRTK